MSIREIVHDLAGDSFDAGRKTAADRKVRLAEVLRMAEAAISDVERSVYQSTDWAIPSWRRIDTAPREAGKVIVVWGFSEVSSPIVVTVDKVRCPNGEPMVTSLSAGRWFNLMSFSHWYPLPSLPAGGRPPKAASDELQMDMF